MSSELEDYAPDGRCGKLLSTSRLAVLNTGVFYFYNKGGYKET